MFFFRINRLKIFDNKEGKKLGFLGKDLAQVKILSFVTTSDMQLPNLDELRATNDEARQKEIITAATQQVVSARILTTIDNVKDNHIMTFGDTGFVLHRSAQIPDDFNWTFIALESDRNVREIGDEVEGVIAHQGFEPFTRNLATLVKGSVTPAFTAGIEISRFVTQIVSGSLKKNKDDMIGILFMSLNRREHYPHGERKRDDVPDLTNNMRIDYSLFGFED